VKTEFRARLISAIIPLCLLAMPFGLAAMSITIADADASSTFPSPDVRPLADFDADNMIDGNLTGQANDTLDTVQYPALAECPCLNSYWIATNSNGGADAATPVVWFDLASLSRVDEIVLYNATNHRFRDRQTGTFRVWASLFDPSALINGLADTEGITTADVAGFGFDLILNNVALTSELPVSNASPLPNPMSAQSFAVDTQVNARFVIIQILDFGVNPAGTTPQNGGLLGAGLTEVQFNGIENVPEPGTVALLGLGLVAFGCIRKRSAR